MQVSVRWLQKKITAHAPLASAKAVRSWRRESRSARCTRTKTPAIGERLLARLGFRWLMLAIGVLFVTSIASPAQRWHAAGKTQLAPLPPPPLEDMAHMSWVRRDGAPSDITALAQTKDRYLWIGSGLGLFRFDGLQFSSYPFTAADPQLPSSNISALAADQDGGLWIGYRMGGISYLRDGKKTDYDRRNGLVSESTEQLLCRDDGSVWATADGRLMRFTGTGWENYSGKHGLSSDGLYSLFFDRDGNLWTAYREHVFELKKGADQFEPISMPNHAVNQFAQTRDGTIWISDAWNSVRPLLDNDSSKAVRIPGVPLLLVDAAGSLWLAHDTGGITRIKQPGSTRQVENFTPADGLTDGQTRAILNDNQGTIWIGTARGLDRFQASPITAFHGVRIDYYPAIVADRTSGIWIDDMDKPLMRLRDGKLSFMGKAHGSSSLFQDKDGAVWLHDSITHNFYRYTETEAAPQEIPVPDAAKEVENWCFGQEQQGAMLACFEGHGLWRYTGTWEQVKVAGLPQESPLSLIRGKANRVWLGYPHNQIALDDESGFHIYGRNEGLELNAVLTFYDADDLTLAAGSDGLAYFDGQRFHSMRLRAPDLLRNISGIVRDRFGYLWLNGGAGIIRLAPEEWKAALTNPEHAMDFQFFSERDGLFGSPAQSKPTPSAVVDSEGKLWFATSGHLVSIDPAEVKNEQTAPQVLLQSVLVNGSVMRLSEAGALRVEARHLHTLEFDYIAVDLRSPHRVQYQYRLDGQDTDWQDVGARRQAYYTNLPPGRYQFHVRAAMGTGPWSEMQAGLPFTVSPAFYQTRWFFLLCALAALALSWGFYRRRVGQVAERLDSQYQARLSERTRIAQELHDTLLQGVLSASMQLNVANDQMEPQSAKPIVERVLQLLGRVIEDGRNAVQGLRVSNERTENLARSFSQIPEELGIRETESFRVIEEGAPRPVNPLVRDDIYRIGREAVANALRHSQARSIEVSIDYAMEELRLHVRDNGCGMDSKMLNTGRERHWGLSGMRERAQKIGGSLTLWSSRESGTEVDLRVPAQIAFRTNGSNGPSKWTSILHSQAEMRVTSRREKRVE
jgi:signal transduction histidine kinase/ligand-binding sensor domain-containing protein